LQHQIRARKGVDWFSLLAGCPADFKASWLVVSLPKSKTWQGKAQARLKNLQQSWMKLAEDISLGVYLIGY